MFTLIATLIVRLGNLSIEGNSELNSDQEKQIDCLIITSQDEEKGVIKKANGLAANTPYYIGEMFDETTPMVVSNQFVIPVHKYGIPGKEPEYNYHNESLKAVILNRSKKNWQPVRKKK